jgi:hypothetical protein
MTLCTLVQSAYAVDIVVNGTLSGTNTWTNNNTYILEGIVYVGNGTPAGTATLSIEKGTIIRGRSGSALVVTRSSTIFAWGTVHQPVIFTADVLPGESLAAPCRNTTARGLWGGVIILGRATVNVPGGVATIEVLPPSGLRTRYGGGATPQDEESSGVLRYVSIRHPGQDLGAGADVNGLTLGGVGSGTALQYVEVYCGLDDSFEWFGGRVSAKYLVSTFNEDDAFDLDQGYAGDLQFLFSLHSSNVGDSCLEVGSAAPDVSNVDVHVANAKCVGANNPTAPDNDPAVTVRGASTLRLDNSILEQYPQECLEIEAGSTAIVRTNDWFDFDSYPPPPATTRPFRACVVNNGTFTLRGNRNLNPRQRGISRIPNGRLDPRLRPLSPLFVRTGARPLPANGFFETTQYLGAFDTTELWLCNWTALDAAGYLPNLPCN